MEFGWRHITDLGAYDHMLFLITLCAVYAVKDWRKILILVSAFTIGHSLTLALVALDLIRIPAALIEFLIPITILATAIFNVAFAKTTEGRIWSVALRWHYGITFSFGLIHGMGFSNYFRSLVGSTGELVQTLLAFNVGVELGQLMIVGLYFLFLLGMSTVFKIKHREWNLFFSGAGAGVAIILILGQLVG